jgi:hypothetical protein
MNELHFEAPDNTPKGNSGLWRSGSLQGPLSQRKLRIQLQGFPPGLSGPTEVTLALQRVPQAVEAQRQSRVPLYGRTIGLLGPCVLSGELEHIPSPVPRPGIFVPRLSSLREAEEGLS